MVHRLVPGEDRIQEVTFDRLEKRKVRVWVHGKPERGSYPPRPGDGKEG